MAGEPIVRSKVDSAAGTGAANITLTAPAGIVAADTAVAVIYKESTSAVVPVDSNWELIDWGLSNGAAATGYTAATTSGIQSPGRLYVFIYTGHGAVPTSWKFDFASAWRGGFTMAIQDTTGLDGTRSGGPGTAWAVAAAQLAVNNATTQDVTPAVTLVHLASTLALMIIGSWQGWDAAIDWTNLPGATPQQANVGREIAAATTPRASAGTLSAITVDTGRNSSLVAGIFSFKPVGGGGPGARSGGDTSAATDAGTRTTSKTRTPASDTSAATDSGTRALSRSRTGADAAGASDAGSRSSTSKARGGNDASTATDATSRSLSASRASADVVGASDGSQRLLSAPRSAGDGAGASESATRALGIARTAADTPGVADGGARGILLMSRSGGDTAGASDIGTTGGTLVRSGADASTVTDAVARATSIARSAGDTASIVDSGSTGTPTMARGGADAAAVIEAAQRLLSTLRSASDVITVADAGSNGEEPEVPTTPIRFVVTGPDEEPLAGVVVSGRLRKQGMVGNSVVVDVIETVSDVNGEVEIKLIPSSLITYPATGDKRYAIRVGGSSYVVTVPNDPDGVTLESLLSP